MQEIWKEIKLYGRTYEVSNLGQVRTVEERLQRSSGEYYTIRPRVLKQRLNSDGYCQVTVGFHSKRTVVRVHRLVAMAFIPNPQNKEEVNHIDFDRTNNRVDNLEWVSHSDNIKYSAINNKEVISASKAGANNGRATYTEDDVRKIREMYDNGISVMDIIKEFYPTLDFTERKKKWSRVSDIAKRKTFKNIA